MASFLTEKELMKKCSICGRTEKEIRETKKGWSAINNIEEHHLNYYTNKTIFLCKSCHKKWHNQNKPIGSRKEMFLLKRIREGNVKGEEWKKNAEWFFNFIDNKREQEE